MAAPYGGAAPVIGWYLLKRVLTAPRQGVAVLAVQVVAFVAAAAPERVNDFETPGVMRLASKWVRLKVVLTPFAVD